MQGNAIYLSRAQADRLSYVMPDTEGGRKLAELLRTIAAKPYGTDTIKVRVSFGLDSSRGQS